MYSDQSLRTTGNSSEIISDIFEVHFPKAKTVLDLTYGTGLFWKKYIPSKLITNDLYVPGTDYKVDFTNQFDMISTFRSMQIDVVVFDPPFTSYGRSKVVNHQTKYGASRHQTGGPTDLKDVQERLLHGLLSIGDAFPKKIGLVVKMQDVVESRVFWNSCGVVESLISELNRWRMLDKVYFLGSRYPQPNFKTIEHFRNKPSIFYVARRMR